MFGTALYLEEMGVFKAHPSAYGLVCERPALAPFMKEQQRCNRRINRS